MVDDYHGVDSWEVWLFTWVCWIVLYLITERKDR